ncbi:MAG: T9SS type A sorting domain-containing protein [Crocinitomicaceae bacterium]|nr:T9SS type A sorting domain-containing protein [Crocinitomicaceae bacterium]
MKRTSSLLFALFMFTISSISQTTWEVGNTTLTEYDLVTGVQIPWEILWGPDDHIWMTSRKGEVMRIEPETGNYNVVLERNVISNGSGEPGMLGMAMHPDWENSPKVYVVYCTGSAFNGDEHLSVFDWDGTSLVNEEILLTIQAGGIHNGSRLLVLPDNTLLMTAGDIGSSSLAQLEGSLQGKTLRLNLDGSVPDDNPIADSYVYTIGNRNSQGLALGANGIVYSSEHGQNSNDELNIVTAGGNYGWPNVEGFCNTIGEQAFCEENDVIEPLEAWTPCIAVNGIEYYNHEAIPEWQNSILMAVLGGLGGQYERLSVMHLADDGLSVTGEDQFFSSFNQRVRDVAVNPYTGSVYVAFNGTSYPGNGPNIIKEFRNESFASSLSDDLQIGATINAFPNPANDNIRIDWDMPMTQGEFEVYSYNGQLIKRGTLNGANSSLVLDTSDWSAGSYFVRAVHAKGTVTATFQVAH